MMSFSSLNLHILASSIRLKMAVLWEHMIGMLTLCRSASQVLHKSGSHSRRAIKHGHAFVWHCALHWHPSKNMHYIRYHTHPRKNKQILTQGTISTFISNTGTILFAEISLYHAVALGSTWLSRVVTWFVIMSVYLRLKTKSQVQMKS